MSILQFGISVFLVIEALNVILLYFSPGSKRGNALGVFTAWDKAQNDEQMKRFVNYLSSWVAGTKLIFILVGIVVVVWGNVETQLATAGALVLSISTFFYRLYPAIKKMDQQGEIEPQGYSKTLLLMIVAFILGFVTIFFIGLVKYLGIS